MGSNINGNLTVQSHKEYNEVVFKIFLICNGVPVTTSESGSTITLKTESDNTIRFCLPLGRIAPGKYTMKMLLCIRNDHGGREYLDVIMDSYCFEIIAPDGFQDNQKWITKYNGYIVGEPIDIISEGR